MKFTTILVVIGSAIMFYAIVPYLVDVVKKKTRPRIVSWFNWTILTAIAGAAALADHQYPAAVLSFVSAFATLLVTILGLHHGNRDFDKTDIICQLGAATGLFLWFAFNSPAMAVIASVSVDAIAAIPTLKHAWKKPGEETLSTFVVSTVGAGLVLVSVRETSFTALTYPIYIVAANLLLSVIISYRRSSSKLA